MPTTIPGLGQSGAAGRTSFGHVLAGDAQGRAADDDTTVFDSTGLALQDLAVALVALESTDQLDLPHIPL